MNRRQLVAAGATALLPGALAAAFGHAGQHMARSVLVPGAGLYDQRPFVGGVLTAVAVGSTIAWFRWGLDWLAGATVLVAVVLTGLLTTSAVQTPQPPDVFGAAHEFPLVILVLGAFGWVRALVRRVPLVGRLRLRPERAGLAPVDRCRAAAIAALAGAPFDVDSIDAPDVVVRSRRIGLLARARRGGDPLRVDHAHVRAALALTGRLDDEGIARLRADSAASWTGVACSEPGWTRLLDGTLVALATGEPKRWTSHLETTFQLRRGHRAAWAWTPLQVPAGRADDWEHAAATALAHEAGWIGDDDWSALRRRALGAAARGVGHPADERLVAAGRIWARLVDDAEASRLLARPTIARDGLAVALDAYARHLVLERTAA